MNFDEYIQQGEPSQSELAANWQMAIGLQQVDGLTPSEYLLETARQNIEGDITILEAQSRIEAYYQQQTTRESLTDDRTEEADKVSARITEIISEQTFKLTPIEYLSIHERLFKGIYRFAGRIRDYNITKQEWALDGDTVLYASATTLRETLDYDFAQEKQFDYQGLTEYEAVRHIARFISDIWQIHPFGEGNTRTTAVFAIKYLRVFGFKVNNDMFAQHSWYFRNALVRANYSDAAHGIYDTDTYLMRFFGNLLLGEKNDLKNRELHVKWDESGESIGDV